GGGRAAQVLVEDDLGPALVGEDPLDHERLWQKLYWRVQSIGRRGLVMQAPAALDLALGDLKGKVARWAPYKLPGCDRHSAAVDANQRWDFPTALRMGREFQRLGCAWFEEPMTCEDPAGHARLAEALDIPIALGETLQSRFEIQHYLLRDAVDIVQPDLTRVG